MIAPAGRIETDDTPALQTPQAIGALDGKLKFAAPAIRDGGYTDQMRPASTPGMMSCAAKTPRP
jgi:hypothetical protein